MNAFSNRTSAFAGLAFCLAGQTAAAQNLITDNTSIISNLCVGAGCATTETYAEPVQESIVRLRNNRVRIELVDVSSPTLNFPTNDWSIFTNDWVENGEECFAIQDDDGGKIPFRIDAGAPTNALRVDDTGDLGLGTAFPAADIHIVAGLDPAILFEQDSTRVSPKSWLLQGNQIAFELTDITRGVTPFSVSSVAADDSLIIGSAGKVGVGTTSPATTLHVARTDGATQIRVEEGSAARGPRTLVNLINNGRPEIVMSNTATGGEWSFGAGSNFILKQGAVGTDSATKTKLFEIGAAGDAVLAGSLTTGGTSCGGGCDRVFAEDYDLPSIAEHREAMFTLGHLPNVGPTVEGAPINVSDKLGRMLNELEHAHIYITQLEAEVSGLRAGQAALEARLAALEAE